ncbi:MAG TPA: FAD-binding protein, partial [Mycobacterium sp.]|nr:FAD-binding protein [Mycobacterium sp.]
MTRSNGCGGSGRLAGYWQQRADVVVIGTGVAGLVAALAAHRSGRKVVVLSKASDTAT